MFQIKICGITRPADAEVAVQAGADAIGLNFYSRSVRYISRSLAATILKGLSADVCPVAVVVNPLRVDFNDLSGALPRVQLMQHYQDDWTRFMPEWDNLIPAFAVGDREDLEPIRGYLARCREVGQMPAALLVDAHVRGQYGGTGQRAPWEVLGDFDPGVAVVLAGGLTPDNVAEAIRLARPAAVDTASGVEAGPGIKDTEKVRRFVAAAREAFARYGRSRG